jgi:hypothetical protein
MEKKTKKQLVINFLKNNWLNIIILLLLSFLFLNNVSYPEYYSKSVEDLEGNFNPGINQYNKISSLGDENYNIKSANLYINTEDYDKNKIYLNSLIIKYNGKITNENEMLNNKKIRSLYLTVKIPKNELDSFLNEIKTTFGLELENINVYNSDVTEQKQDFTERLNRYKSQIEKYKEMLTQKDLRIEDEIKIQNRIDDLENQIYYLEKSNQDLDNRITYSTVSITLNEKASPLTNVEFKSFKYYIAEFLNSLENGLNIFINLVAYGLELLILFIVYKFVRNKFFK